MKVVMLYHPNSEQEGIAQDFARDYKRFKNKKLELVSLDTIQGSDMARLYDATNYPAVLAIDDSGVMQQMWQGTPMPRLDELDYYTRDQQHGSYAGDPTHRLRSVQPPSA